MFSYNFLLHLLAERENGELNDWKCTYLDTEYQ